MRTTLIPFRETLLCALTLFALWAGVAPVYAQDEKILPIRLRIAGQEVSPDTPAVTDGKAFYLPLTALDYLQAQGKVNANGDKAILSVPAVKLLGEVPVRKLGKEYYLPLTDLAQFLNAELTQPDDLDAMGVPIPGKKGDLLYLLARVTSARFENGQLRVTTSFPIQFQGNVQTETVPARGYVDCIGAALPADFKPALLGKELRLSAVQRNVETVRVILEQTVAIGGVGMPFSPAPPSDATRRERNGPLTLDTLLQQIETNYPKIRVADLDRRIATAKRLEKQGAFDPELFFAKENLRYNSTSTPGRASKSNTTDFAVVFPTPIGLKLEVGGRYHFGSVKSPDSSTGTGGEYYLNLKLPLLRGFGVNEKAAAERQARLGIPLADQDFALERLDILLKGVNTYWKWVASGRKLQVARDLLTVAQQRAEFIRKRFEAGDVREQDLILANQQVQDRLVRLTQAERTLQESAFNLGLFLFESDGVTSYVPAADNLPDYQASLQLLTPAQIEEGRRLALERRPELKSLAIQRDIVQVDRQLARNDRLPAIDLVYSPGADLGSRGIGDTLKFGVTVAIPLRTRNADGRIQAADLKLRGLGQKEVFERQRILNEVADVVNALSNAYQRRAFALTNLQLARKAEQNERDNYAAGGGTLFDVNLAEQNTANAFSALIDIEAEYEQAFAAFRTLTVQPFLTPTSN